MASGYAVLRNYFEKCDGYLSLPEALLKVKMQVTLMDLYMEK
jgi:hypothetical protein